MVEHPVEDDAQAAPGGFGDQAVEVLLIAEPGIYLEVIDGVVAMGAGREDGPEQQARAAKLDRVVEPSAQLPQPVTDGLPRRQRRLLGIRETQWVHMPPDSVLSP